MAYDFNTFGIPPDDGNNPFDFDFQGSTHQPPPGSAGQGETTQGPRPDSSPPLDVNWDEEFPGNRVDGEFDHYMQVINNDNAAVAPAPQEPFGQGQQWDASWQADASLWGQGINGEIVPAWLLPLYTDIPPRFQTREYWTLLVEQARNDIFISSRALVDEMVRLLNLLSTSPETLFGWTQLSAQWKKFFVLDRGFRPGNVTPELWISMVHHLHTSNPRVWRDQPKPAPLQSGSIEQGDPASYVSQYIPTIQTDAPLFSINPDACGPIPNAFNPREKKFPAAMAKHPEWWGDFFDDGPKKNDEDGAQYALRLKWARSNIGIIRRPRENLPTTPKIARERKDQRELDYRKQMKNVLSIRNDRNARIHDGMMDETSDLFNPHYRGTWRCQQAERREENKRRRDAAYEHAARYYRHMGEPVPPKPAPPEDSDDDYFHDLADPVAPNAVNADDERTSEPYRCKPCADGKTSCSFRSQRFPCSRCKIKGNEDQCVSSRLDLIQRADEREKSGKSESWRQRYTFSRPKGPFIPSFAMPPERLEHHIPTQPSGMGAGTVDQFQMSSVYRPAMSIEKAMEVLKRKAGDTHVDANDDNSGPPKSTKKPRATGKKVGERAKGPPKKAPAKAAGVRRRRRKKGDEDEHEEYEPCDNCKNRGEIDWCEKKRPCSNCVLNHRQDTCDASYQNQPYGTLPGGLAYDSDTIAVDTENRYNYTGYDYQPIFGGPGPPPLPLPPLDPDAAAPYSYLQEDIELLWEARGQLGDLPVRRPDAFEDMVRAFITQDNILRQSDPEYRPLIMIQNVEAYFQQRLTALVDAVPPQTDPRLRQPGAGDLTFSDALRNQAYTTMPYPQGQVTEADTLRNQAQQPQSSFQALKNFHSPLSLRQTNLYEPDAGLAYPEDALDVANQGMEWTPTDHLDPLPSGNLNAYNPQSYQPVFDSVFQDVVDPLDPARAEPQLPAIPPVTQVTTGGIARAIQESSTFVNPITWYLEHLRAGYNVENELSAGVKRTAPCTEDLNFWTPARNQQVLRCPAPNGIVCDAWTCPSRASCPNCWMRQKGSVQFVETNLVASTKAWFCRRCKESLDQDRLRANSVQPRLNRCYCVSQLQETRLCDADRVEAQDAIAKKVADEKEPAVLGGWDGRCGHCWANPADATTGAWRCVCCNQVVTLP